MSNTDLTPFQKKCEILAELWIDYKHEEDFADFVSYNDIGLPLAFVLANDIATSTPKSEMFIDETFELLLAALGIDNDEGYDSLADLLLLDKEE